MFGLMGKKKADTAQEETTKPAMLGDDVKTTPINKTLKKRKATAKRNRSKLENAAKKRGTTVGEAK